MYDLELDRGSVDLLNIGDGGYLLIGYPFVFCILIAAVNPAPVAGLEYDWKYQHDHVSRDFLDRYSLVSFRQLHGES